MGRFKVTFYVWTLPLEALGLFERMFTYLKAIVPAKLELATVEVSAYGSIEHTEGPFIVFGKASAFISNKKDLPCLILGDPNIYFPKTGDQDARNDAANKLKLLAEKISQMSTEPIVPTTIHAETADGVTIGPKGTDILIDEREVELVKKIRDLLNCKKIVVTKGDLRIEVINE
jgi:hypothetical protein